MKCGGRSVRRGVPGRIVEMKKSIAIVLGVVVLLAIATPAFARRHHHKHHQNKPHHSRNYKH